MSFRSRVVMLALLVAASGALAQQSKKDLVAKLLQLQQPGIENIARSIAGTTAQEQLQRAGPALQRMPADKREAAGKAIQEEVKKFYDEADPYLRERALRLATTTIAPMYEQKFSEDDLKQIIAWLESPVSAKLAQVDTEARNALIAKVVADSRPTMETRLKVLELSMRRHLGLPPPPPSASAAGSAPKK